MAERRLFHEVSQGERSVSQRLDARLIRRVIVTVKAERGILTRSINDNVEFVRV